MSEPEADLKDLIVQELCGISLHRHRVMSGFSDVPVGPLGDHLFAITRPTQPAERADRATSRTEHVAAPAETPVLKGMVDYRRERWDNHLEPPAEKQEQ